MLISIFAAVTALRVGVPAMSEGLPKVTVMGGSGFTGSRVCQLLAEAGCSVVSVSASGKAPASAAGGHVMSCIGVDPSAGCMHVHLLQHQ